VIYFLSKKNILMLLLCMVVMLFTGSNFINILLVAALVILFIFKSTRDQKSMILVSVMLLVVFMPKVSPQNYDYVHETIKNQVLRVPVKSGPPLKPLPYITLRPDSTLTSEELRQKIATKYLDSLYVITHATSANQVDQPLKTESGRIVTPQPDINTMPYQHVAETTAYQRQLLGFINDHKTSLPISGGTIDTKNKPGKVLAMSQTLSFFRQHPAKLVMGSGMGNFSSKLAFRVNGLGSSGGYPKKYAYVSPDFLSNHLDIYLSFFSKKTDYHSLTNDPGSVYDQLVTEYGLLGLAAFILGYLGYFLRDYKRLTYGIPILLILLAVFTTGYWFEQLSAILFFELLMLLNIKENTPNTIQEHAN
jgi:hypothetical protein